MWLSPSLTSTATGSQRPYNRRTDRKWEMHSEYSSPTNICSLCRVARPQEAKYQKHLHLDTFFFCHCSTWSSYKCPVCISSTNIIIDALFNHLSAMGEVWNSTIKVCRRIYSQKSFRNWVQIQQLAGIINIFLLPKGTQRIRKQDNKTGCKNLIHTEGEIIWWELQ